MKRAWTDQPCPDQIDGMLEHRFQYEHLKDTRRALSGATPDISRSMVDISSDLASRNQQSTGDGGVKSFKVSDLRQPKHFQLQTLLAGATPEVLEAAVETGVEILDKMKIPMVEKAPHAPDAAQWLQQIGKSYGGLGRSSLVADERRKRAKASGQDEDHRRCCRKYRRRQVECHQCHAG